MTAGCGALGASDVGDGGHQLAEEFRRIVRVEDIRGATAKMKFIEKKRCKGSGFPVG